jgi:hypothetical protein
MVNYNLALAFQLVSFMHYLIDLFNYIKEAEVELYQVMHCVFD